MTPACITRSDVDHGSRVCGRLSGRSRRFGLPVCSFPRQAGLATAFFSGRRPGTRSVTESSPAAALFCGSRPEAAAATLSGNLRQSDAR
jgi:hypothetical protein